MCIKKRKQACSSFSLKKKEIETLIWIFKKGEEDHIEVDSCKPLGLVYFAKQKGRKHLSPQNVSMESALL